MLANASLMISERAARNDRVPSDQFLRKLIGPNLRGGHHSCEYLAAIEDARQYCRLEAEQSGDVGLYWLDHGPRGVLN